MNTLANSKPETAVRVAADNPRSIGKLPPPRRDASKKPLTVPAGERLTASDGSILVLRSIHADDVAALQRGFAHLSSDEVRMRFLHPLTDLPTPMALGLCDINPQTTIALVLTDPETTLQPEIYAVARAYLDPVTLAAEFALIVQQRFVGQGFGTTLMHRLIQACRERGALEMWGDVLLENNVMIDLCDHLGFHRSSMLQDPGLLRVTLNLSEANAA